jgi:hypothetical protein
MAFAPRLGFTDIGNFLNSVEAKQVFTNTLNVDGTMVIDGNQTVTGNLTVEGNTVLGNAPGDTVTVSSLTANQPVIANGSSVLTSALITNAHVSPTAAIAYSKLNLANSIVNADINAAAAIADTKLATISTSGKVANSATTATPNNDPSTIVARSAGGSFEISSIFNTSGDLSLIALTDINMSSIGGAIVAQNKLVVFSPADIPDTTSTQGIQFPTDAYRRKIAFYSNADNDNQFNGFGQATGKLILQTHTTTEDISCESGTGPASSQVNLTIKGSGGIQLPTSGGTAATLNFYEEGTFTPTLRFGGGTTGITYTARVGRYVRQNTTVKIWVYILLSNKGSSTGTATITGLPYTANGSLEWGVDGYWANLTYANLPRFKIAGGSSTISMTNMSSGTAGTLLTDTAFANTTDLELFAEYQV